jgi:hypothetical protein
MKRVRRISSVLDVASRLAGGKVLALTEPAGRIHALSDDDLAKVCGGSGSGSHSTSGSFHDDSHVDDVFPYG